MFGFLLEGSSEGRLSWRTFERDPVAAMMMRAASNMLYSPGLPILPAPNSESLDIIRMIASTRSST